MRVIVVIIFVMESSMFINTVALYIVQVSPKQLLGSNELQHHVCSPTKEYSQPHMGDGEQFEYTRLPHHDSRPVEHIKSSHSHGLKSPGDGLSHQQSVGRPLTTGLQHSHFTVSHQSSDQRKLAGTLKYQQPNYHPSVVTQRNWQQRHDHSHPVYDTSARDSVHRHNFSDMVNVTFSASLLLFTLIFTLFHHNYSDSLVKYVACVCDIVLLCGFVQPSDFLNYFRSSKKFPRWSKICYKIQFKYKPPKTYASTRVDFVNL